MKKGTCWTIGAKTYLVTPEQRAALEKEDEVYALLLQEREDSLPEDERYDGHHIGNAPDPFRDIRDRHFRAVQETLGPKLNEGCFSDPRSTVVSCSELPIP